MNDVYKQGAAIVLGIDEEKITHDQRRNFKYAFWNTLYDLIKGSPYERGQNIKDMVDIIANGVDQNFSDDRIREILSARLDRKSPG